MSLTTHRERERERERERGGGREGERGGKERIRIEEGLKLDLLRRDR